MVKKAIAMSFLSVMLLAGCNANDDDDALVPPGNETPMEDMQENDEKNDVNKDEDKDMMDDENTPEEEVIEDDMDARDEDDKDK